MFLPPAPAAESTPPFAAAPAASAAFLGGAQPFPLRWWWWAAVELAADRVGDTASADMAMAAVGVGVPPKAKKDVAGPVMGAVGVDRGGVLGKLAAPARGGMVGGGERGGGAG